MPTQAGDLEGSSQASASEPEEPVCKQARVLDRQASYVIVELPGAIFRLHKAGASGCWMGRRRAFRNSRDFVARPKAHEYTHVCRLCWPNRYQGSDDDPSEGSLANSGDEQAPLEAVPASSQIPQLGVMLPANFANFGFSAPRPLKPPLSRFRPVGGREGGAGRGRGGREESMSACALGHLLVLHLCCLCARASEVLGHACQSCTTTL